MSHGDGAGAQLTATTPFSVGAQAPDRDFGPLTRQMFVRYAGASGDLNPMHYDDQLAQSAGYPSVFAQGMFSAALLAGFATDWLGAGNVRHFGVRFREQVWPGDVLTCPGSVTAVSAGPAEPPPGAGSPRGRWSCSVGSDTSTRRSTRSRRPPGCPAPPSTSTSRAR